MSKYISAIIILFEIITALLALINFYKYKNTYEKYFLYFLWVVVLIEIVGYVSNNYFHKVITPVYNIYLILSFIFYFYWYFNIIKSIKQKNIIKFLSGIFIIVSLKDLIYSDYNFYFFTTFIVGAVIILILSFFYFSQLLKSDNVLNVYHNLRFWIVTGLMLFNIGMIPFMVYTNELFSYSIVYMSVLLSLNFVLYFCYSIGFLWCKPVQ